MASNRVLETIKRLLSAETYFRSQRRTKDGEPKAPAPDAKSQS